MVFANGLWQRIFLRQFLRAANSLALLYIATLARLTIAYPACSLLGVGKSFLIECGFTVHVAKKEPRQVRGIMLLVSPARDRLHACRGHAEEGRSRSSLRRGLSSPERRWTRSPCAASSSARYETSENVLP